MSKGKVTIAHLLAGLIKTMLDEISCVKMNQYFPKPYKPFGGDINVKVELSNFETKANFKNATGIDTSKLDAKSDFASSKAEVDKLDIDKLVPVPVDLNELSDVVKNDVVKKLCMINQLPK